MPKKTPTKQGDKAKVTFELPPSVGAKEEVAVYGDFTDWNPAPLQQRKDGRYSATFTLPRGQSFRYRFLIDGERWENDWQADEYLPNDFGTEDSVIHV